LDVQSHAGVPAFLSELYFHRDDVRTVLGFTKETAPLCLRKMDAMLARPGTETAADCVLLSLVTPFVTELVSPVDKELKTTDPATYAVAVIRSRFKTLCTALMYSLLVCRRKLARGTQCYIHNTWEQYITDHGTAARRTSLEGITIQWQETTASDRVSLAFAEKQSIRSFYTRKRAAPVKSDRPKSKKRKSPDAAESDNTSAADTPKKKKTTKKTKRITSDTDADATDSKCVADPDADPDDVPLKDRLGATNAKPAAVVPPTATAEAKGVETGTVVANASYAGFEEEAYEVV